MATDARGSDRRGSDCPVRRPSTRPDRTHRCADASCPPRAIGVGYVAVPTRRRALRLADRDSEVRFVTREVGELDAVAMTTELGQALVTTPEQTVLDLARADPRAGDLDAQEAIDALWPECDPAVLEEIAGRQRMRATYARVAASR
ncbi:MAG: type IV toxin-antitoxin system AbiEi family antitoxin [Cellulomonas sp.]|nr:type IV toxin-antitoxin system AbiEi family antitoxin [Cellulomonas sp.]MCR6706350.1 type IV toxin-antitoxin system AbiEi family antitoxin [Cellulomonas sp.]